MIVAKFVDRFLHNVRSRGNARKKVDLHIVAYQCPPDETNAHIHEWMCGFEIPRGSIPAGSRFPMQNYPDKASAISASDVSKSAEYLPTTRIQS